MKLPNEIFKAHQLSDTLIEFITIRYGPINYKWDFFSSNLKTYYKIIEYDEERLYSHHKVIKLSALI
jgi:hypothetical protein